MTATWRDRSYWNDTTGADGFPQLSGKMRVDIAVIGGGIVGMTTARMLKNRGQTVAVIEAREVGRQVTGRSTAKVRPLSDPAGSFAAAASWRSR